MKKKLLSLTLCLVFIFVSASPAFAAITAASAGFYDIGTATGVTITPLAGSTEVAATSVDVDGDNVNETYYPNSDRLTVVMAGAVSGKEYTLSLIAGNGVPGDNSEYYDVRQVTADSSTVTFDVNPKLPEESTALTLYINSNAPGFVAKSISLNYAHVAEMGDKPSFTDTPTIVVAGTTAQVTYSATAGDAPISKFEVMLDGVLYRELASNINKCAIQNLTIGTTYTVTVVATNAYGSTESEAVSFTAGKKPSFSSAPAVVVGNQTATISFSAADNGVAITSYQIKLDGNVVATLDGSATDYTFTGLANGTTYSATVVATNAVGSTESAAVSFAPVDPTSGTTVSGTVTSYLDAAETVTVELFTDGSATAAYDTTATGNSAAYSVANVASGNYTMKVSKANHVTREYAVEVANSAVTQDAKIHPLGDVDGNGRISIMDVNATNFHFNGQTTLGDYQFDCADVDRNSRISIMDVNRINFHFNGTALIW